LCLFWRCKVGPIVNTVSMTLTFLTHFPRRTILRLDVVSNDKYNFICVHTGTRLCLWTSELSWMCVNINVTILPGGFTQATFVFTIGPTLQRQKRHNKLDFIFITNKYFLLYDIITHEYYEWNWNNKIIVFYNIKIKSNLLCLFWRCKVGTPLKLIYLPYKTSYPTVGRLGSTPYNQ
jgi:hypothetical protein